MKLKETENSNVNLEKSSSNSIAKIPEPVKWAPRLNPTDPDCRVFLDYTEAQKHNKYIFHHHKFQDWNIFNSTDDKGKPNVVAIPHVDDTEFNQKYKNYRRADIDVLSPRMSELKEIESLRDKYQAANEVLHKARLKANSKRQSRDADIIDALERQKIRFDSAKYLNQYKNAVARYWSRKLEILDFRAMDPDNTKTKTPPNHQGVKNICSQTKHINTNDVFIYSWDVDVLTHPRNHNKVKPRKHEIFVLDYLENFRVKFTRVHNVRKWIESSIDGKKEYKALPILLDISYTFFGAVELYHNHSDHEWLDALIAMQCISQKRKLSTNAAPGENSRYNHAPVAVVDIELPDGSTQTRVLRHKAIDVSAMLGQMSYKKMAKTLGIKLEAKGNVDDLDMGDMHENFQTHFEMMIAYSVGDMRVYEMLASANNYILEMCHDLNVCVPDNLEVIQLSMGSNVKVLVERKIKDEFDINSLMIEYPDVIPILQLKTYKALKKKYTKNREPSDITQSEMQDYLYSKMVTPNSSSYIASVGYRHSSVTAAKGFGGRAICEIPEIIRGFQLLDVDMEGAYATCQQYLEYPFGLARKFGSTISPEMPATTLRRWIELELEKQDALNQSEPDNPCSHVKLTKTIEDTRSRTTREVIRYEAILELIHSCMFSMSFQNMPFHQDYFPSWIRADMTGTLEPYEIVSRMLKVVKQYNTSNEMDVNISLDGDKYLTKYFMKSCVNSPLTLPALDYIFNMMSESERDQWLDQAIVTGGFYYLNADRCSMNEAIRSFVLNDEEKDTHEVSKGGTDTVATSNRSYKFFGKTMGDILVTDLMAKRKQYPKKTPMNVLFKLFCNTTYGDIVSKWFDFGNVVYGNAITALCRHEVYKYTKSCLAIQSITDGALCRIHEVLFRLTDEKFNFYRATIDKKHFGRYLKRGNLGGIAKLELVETSEAEYRATFNHPDLTDTEIDALIGDAFEDYKYLPTFKFVYEDGTEEIVSGYTYKKSTVSLNGEEIEIVVPKLNYLEKLNRLVEEHIRNQFPHSIYRDVFSIGIKDVYQEGTFTGMTDYHISSDWLKKAVKKKRSHEASRQHFIPWIDEEGDVNYIPRASTKDEIFGLIEQATKKSRGIKKGHCEPPEIFCKEQMVKIGAYANQLHLDREDQHEFWTWSVDIEGNKYRKNSLFPGASLVRVGVAKLATLSQFKFENMAQFHNWNVAYTKLCAVNLWGFESLYYEPKTGHVNYKKMVREMRKSIEAGNYFDNKKFQTAIPHPDAEKVLDIKAILMQPTVWESDPYDSIDDDFE